MNYIDIEYNKKRSQHRNCGRIKKCFLCGKDTCIQSHSISQSRCLHPLAEEIEGQKGVYGFDSVIWKRSDWYNGSVLPGNFKLIGTNIASTFTGFCSDDDRSIFFPIDNSNFDSNSSEQCFLYCYRAFARGYRKKQEEQKSCESKSTFASENPDYVTKNGKECHIALTLDMLDFPNLLNKWLNHKEFNGLYHFHIRTKCFLPVASASIIQPSFDIMNNKTNDYSVDTPLNHIFLNIIPEEQTTHILISCFKSQEKSLHFIDLIKEMYELGKKDELGTYLTTLLVFFTENTFFKPSLINGLVYWKKRNLLLNLRHSICYGIQDHFINNPIKGSWNLFEDML